MYHRIRRFLLILAVLIAIYSLGSSAYFRFRLNDFRRMDFNYIQFREALKTDQFEAAYTFMSPDYRQSHSLDEFKNHFSGLYLHPLYPNRYLSFNIRRAKLMPEYDRFGPFFQSSLVLEWEKVGDEWYLTGKIDQMLD